VALFGRIERRLGSDDVSDAAIHRELAALARDRLRDVAGAIAHLEEAAALEPGRIETWQTLAAMHGDAGHEADVFRCLEAELATEPDDDRRRHLHTRAAEIAQAREDTDHAEEHYRALLALDPSAAAAVAFLADLYETSERHA
jgi:tetratricopeptide (TPR) repeat protein